MTSRITAPAHAIGCDHLPQVHIEFVADPDQRRPQNQHSNYDPSGGWRVLRRCRCGKSREVLTEVMRQYELAHAAMLGIGS